MAEEPNCCADICRSSFFPYKRVIRGGKQVILPVKDSKGNICGFDPSLVDAPHEIEVSITNSTRQIHGGLNAAFNSANTSRLRSGCGCHQTQASQHPEPRRGHCLTDPPFPLIGQEGLVPMSASVRKALHPTEDQRCRHLTTPYQRLIAPRQNALQEQLQSRIKDIEVKSANLPERTPMSLFRNDNRFLMKAFRNYKRDVQLQRERGVNFDEPKRFPDEITRKWYYDMIGSDTQCVSEEARESLNQTDCYHFGQEGASCFHCPVRDLHNQVQRNIPPQSGSTKLCNC